MPINLIFTAENRKYMHVGFAINVIQTAKKSIIVAVCWNNRSKYSSTLVRKLTIEMLSDFCGLEALEFIPLYSV